MTTNSGLLRQRSTTKKLFSSGDKCPTNGLFRFSGFINELVGTRPREDELEIFLKKGTFFPKIQSTSSECFWELL